MPKNELEATRRRALQHIVDTDTRWSGNVSAFARSVRKQQSQIADTLAGRKSFGEKVARKLEIAAGLEIGILDREPGRDRVAEPLVRYGLPVTPEEIDLGREWGKLHEPLRTQYRVLIEMAVAAQFRAERPDPKKPGRAKRDDRPRAT